MTATVEGTAWVGGRVFTGRRYVEALLVEDGEIIASGTRRAVLRNKASGTQVRNLAGQLIVPGLIDAHMHLAETVSARQRVDLRGVSSLKEFRTRVDHWSSDHPTGPIVGGGWDQELLRNRRFPTCDDLDRMSQDRPILLKRICGHVAVVNTLVLEELGLDRASVDPPGGRIGRAANGTPNGLLFDSALDRLPVKWRRTSGWESLGMDRTLRYAASLGLTSLGAMNARPEEVRSVCHRALEGPLPVSVHFFLSMKNRNALGSLRSGAVDGQIHLTGVKAFTDGSFGARTAWLRAPYADSPGERGLSVGSEEELRSVVEWAEENMLVPALHAIGDRALLRVLRLYQSLPSNRLRRIEHASLTPPSVLKQIDLVNPTLVVQPSFVEDDWWLYQRLGPRRTRWAYLFRSLLTRGNHPAGSSDSPAAPLDPWQGMTAAIRRQDDQGRSANRAPQEALTAEEALTLYTANAGVAVGEPKLGRLESGSSADFVVLRTHTFQDALTLGRSCVLETWRAGRSVFRAPERSSPSQQGTKRGGELRPR